MGQAVKKQFYVHNNVKLATLDDERCRYAFIDSIDHRADRILTGSLIPAVFEVVEERVEHDGFELRVCSFKSRYESWFLCCMSDLEWVLQVDGNYVKACEHLLGLPVVIRTELKKLSEQAKASQAFEPSAGLRLLGI